MFGRESAPGPPPYALNRRLSLADPVPQARESYCP